MNLRLVVDSQRLLSGQLAKLAQPVEPALHEKWLAREQTYVALRQELRNVGGRIGSGGLAVAEGANAVSRLKAIPSNPELDPRVLHGIDKLFTTLDSRVADIIEDGMRRNVYVARVKIPRIAENNGQMIGAARERYAARAAAEHTALIDLVQTQLRPIPESPAAPPGAARSRAELHAGIVHRPGGRRGQELAL